MIEIPVMTVWVVATKDGAGAGSSTVPLIHHIRDLDSGYGWLSLGRSSMVKIPVLGRGQR
jgi:hypothetical protein